MNKVTLALSVLAIGVASSFAQATESSDTYPKDVINPVPKVLGYYIGGSIGTGKFYINRDSGEYNSKYYQDQASLAEKDASSGAQSFQLLAGYQLSRIVAVEMDYTRYINNLNFRGFVWNPTVGMYQPQKIHARPTIFSIQTNVGYTFPNGIRPFALAGISLLHLGADKDIYDADFSSSVTGFRLGTGVEYAPVILQGLAFRASWTIDLATMNSENAPDNPILLLFPNDYSDHIRLSSFNIGATYKF